MKIILSCLLAAVTFCAGAQQQQQPVEAFNVYTLQPIDSLTFESDAAALEIHQADGKYTIHNYTESDVLTIGSPGFQPQEIELKELAKDPVIFLRPDDSLRRIYEKRHPFYGEPTDTTGVFKSVDEPAEFPGGLIELRRYLGHEVYYPQDAIEIGCSGKVFLQFIVEADGTLTNIVIRRGMTESMDVECIRVLQKMPKWNPGKIDGKAVRSYSLLPISFTIY